MPGFVHVCGHTVDKLSQLVLVEQCVARAEAVPETAQCVAQQLILTA